MSFAAPIESFAFHDASARPRRQVRSFATHARSAHCSYRTDRYGLASDSTNWRTEWFGRAGSVRLNVPSAGQKPIFVGRAAADAVSRYLSGTSYSTVAEHRAGVVRTDHEGAAPTIPPASRATSSLARSQPDISRKITGSSAVSVPLVLAKTRA
jgi:hypothetical protein